MNQRQDSLTDQMRDLIPYAIERGMYDAADYINRRFPQVERFPQVGQSTIIEERPPMDAPPEQKLDLANNQLRFGAHLKLVPKEKD